MGPKPAKKKVKVTNEAVPVFDNSTVELEETVEGGEILFHISLLVIPQLSHQLVIMPNAEYSRSTRVGELLLMTSTLRFLVMSACPPLVPLGNC